MPSSAPLWTPMSLIRVTAEFFADKGIESARLDAELLLAHVLDCNRLQLYLDSDRPIVPDELDRYRALVKRRGEREPLQLLVGSVEIMDHEFEVRPGVFIPRPETEILIETCRELALADEATIVEVGVGTGCIGLSLLSHFPTARLVGFDVNPKAIELAAANAARLGLDERAEFRLEDARRAAIPPCDLLVSNPPYVPAGEIPGLQPEVRDHDPVEALDGGADGLDFVRALLPRAVDAVRAGGAVAMEHADSQGPAIAALFGEAGLREVVVRRDLTDRDRVTVGHRA